MSRILVVGEDLLCCSIGEKLVARCLPNWELARASVDTKGVTKLLPSVSRFIDQAIYVQPVLCIADTDGSCPVDIRNSNLPKLVDDRFVFCLAVTEAESWLLGDRRGFAEYFRVPISRIPQRPDKEADPKRLILHLAVNSRVRAFREEMVSTMDQTKQGSGYNTHLRAFVYEKWDPVLAAESSPSLARAVRRIGLLYGS